MIICCTRIVKNIFSIYNRKIMKERNQQSFSQEAMNEVNTLTLIDQYQNQHWNWSIDGHEFLSFWHFGKWNLSPTAACDVMKHLQDSAVDRPSVLVKGKWSCYSHLENILLRNLLRNELKYNKYKGSFHIAYVFNDCCYIFRHMIENSVLLSLYSTIKW